MPIVHLFAAFGCAFIGYLAAITLAPASLIGTAVVAFVVYITCVAIYLFTLYQLTVKRS